MSEEAEPIVEATAPTDDELKAEELFKKLYQPQRMSKHLKYLEIPEFDAKEAFVAERIFEISERGLDDADASKLAAAMRVFRPAEMEELYIYLNHIGDAGFTEIVGELHHLPQLDLLWAAQNEISDAGFASFGQLVASGGAARLTRLVMHGNKIGDAGAKAFADAIADGALPELKWLFLNENEIGDAGVEAIARALEGGACPKLTRLALQNNKLGDQALYALAEMVTKGGMKEVGEYIYVQENAFSKAGREALSSAMAGLHLQGHFGWPLPKTQAELAAGERRAQRRAEGRMEYD